MGLRSLKWLQSPKHLQFAYLHGASTKIIAAGSETPARKVKGTVPRKMPVDAEATTMLNGLTMRRSAILAAVEGRCIMGADASWAEVAEKWLKTKHVTNIKITVFLFMVNSSSNEVYQAKTYNPLKLF